MNLMHKRALFLIHGFTEDCDQSFGKFLMHVNLDDYQIIKHTVVGHNGIDKFDYDLAIKKLENEFEVVRESFDEVVVMGFSMGGLLGSYLASNYTVDKLVLIAPAFKCIIESKAFELLTEAGKELLVNRRNIANIKENFENYFLEKYSSQDIIFNDLSPKNITDLKHAFINFKKLLDYVTENFKEIDCPTLIIHGDKDEAVPVESSLFVLNKITNKSKLLVIAPGYFHRVLNEKNSSIYYDGIEQFICNDVFKIDFNLPKKRLFL